MSKVQLFKRENSNLDDFKSLFVSSLKELKKLNIFDEELFDYFNVWVNKQTSYVPRKDISNLPENIKLLLNNKEFYNLYLSKKSTLKKDNLLSYWFNLISLLDDLVFEYKQLEKEKIRQQKLKQELEKESKQKKQELETLEKLLDEL